MRIELRIFILLGILFLASAGIASAQDSSAPGGIEEVMKEATQFNKRMEVLIEKYKSADPGKDAEVAFRENNLKFISIMGYAPGTDDEYPIVEEYGTFSMPDTGDVILSQKHGEFQQVAHDYARRYNDAMLSLIKKQNEAPRVEARDFSKRNTERPSSIRAMNGAVLWPRTYKQPLTLMVKSDKQVYQAGENIRLSVSLENRTGKEIIVYWNNDAPVLETDKTGIVVASMPVIRIKDFEILHIKAREVVQRDVLVKSDTLSGDIKLALQYKPMELKIAQKISADQEVFRGTLISNMIALRVDQRAPDVLDVECMRALSIGAKYIVSSKLAAGDYKLIKAENMVMGDSCIGPHIWHLTYKAKDLIERGGKGGEIFVEVDMNTQQAKLLGYGE